MKQLNYRYPNKGLHLLDVPEPQVVRPTDVKIKVEYCAICGSDVHTASGSFDYMYTGVPENFCVPLGHEVSGVVTEVGQDCTRVKVGDRVTYNNNRGCGQCYFCRNRMENFCRSTVTTQGGMGEYVVTDESQVYQLPGDISLREGCLTEPTSIAMRAIQRAEIRPGMSVAVFGGGPIGALVLQLARLSGAYPLALMDVVPEKLEFARSLGADAALNSGEQDLDQKARELTNGRGFDVVIECSGALPALDAACNLVAPGGTLVITSAYRGGAKYELDLGSAFYRELTIRSVFLSPGLFDRSVRILERLDLDKIITGEFPLDEYEKAFEAQRSGKHVKVILKVGGGDTK